ncbi:Heat shock protein 70 [Akanthomyces lecanii RCEF 1005]|uniref:Heat shock protein 70 n=1 Tax=Akanthomyces lecanii RCEF 1005 TaxID=1081108 RepID=A0A167XKP2_CORDF|nr:Heat shock protein 70 [Akanthomyces lecanii RCEF 1005]
MFNLEASTDDYSDFSASCGSKMASEALLLFLDLGTTKTCAVVLKKNGPQVLVRNYADRFFPSSISIKNGKWYVGLHSKTDIAEGYQVFHNPKRVIGRNTNDGLLEDDIKKCGLPYKIDEHGEPYADIDGQRVTPTEIVALFVCETVKMFEKMEGMAPTGCKIVVPAYFSSQQIQATIDAVKIAGLEVHGVLIEPGAVALEALWDHKENGTFLVMDCGGGTTDLAIVDSEVTGKKHNLVVRASNGDNRLGGEDFLDVMVRCFMGIIPGASYDELRFLCGSVKILRPGEPITIQWRGKPYSITYSTYTTACRELLMRIDRLLDFDGQKHKVDGYILAGGACQLHPIQSRVDKKHPNIASLPAGAPGETPALGAARSSQIGCTITQGLSRSIGIGCVPENSPETGSFMNVILQRNEPLPTSDSKAGITARFHETPFCLYEGEHLEDVKNIFMGEFTVVAPPETKFKVEVEVTSNMEVKVSATADDGTMGNLTVHRDKRPMSDTEIERLRELTMTRFRSSEDSPPKARKRRKNWNRVQRSTKKVKR